MQIMQRLFKNSITIEEKLQDVEGPRYHYLQSKYSKPEKDSEYLKCLESNSSFLFLRNCKKEPETSQEKRNLDWLLIFEQIKAKRLKIKMKNLSWSDIPKYFPELTCIFPADELFKFVLTNSDQLLIGMSEIKSAAAYFPQYKAELFEHMFNNPNRINCTDQMHMATEIFPEPQFKDKLFAFVFDNTGLFFRSWGHIKQLLLSFPLPHYVERIRDFVFKNPTLFLAELGDINAAIEVFPQAAVKEYLFLKSNAEIRKNARVFAQQSYIPPELGVKIVALTGKPDVHTEEQAAEIEQRNYSRP